MICSRSCSHLACAKRFVASCAAVLAIGGCERAVDGVLGAPDPVAAIHWVNASPDVGALDMRPIDIVTNAGLFGAGFGVANANAQPIPAGTRTIRLFLANSSTVVWEGSHTFVAGQRYTFFVHGPAAALAVDIEHDAPPDPGAGQVAVRAVMLNPAFGDVDVFVGTEVSGLPGPSPTWTGVRYAPAGTGYTSFPAGPLRIAATAAGTTEPPLVSNRPMLAGAPPTSAASAVPGVTQAGSVVTAILLGGAPGAIYLNHRRPDR